MIVVAIIVILAAIAIPSIIAARLNANEASAISTLRTILTAQAQFQLRATADVDGDGVGEFGMFRELSGAVDVRDSDDGTFKGVGSNVLRPAVLPGAFRTMKNTHEFGKSGYHFRIFLTGTGGRAVSEHGTNKIHGGPIDADLSETTWCAYAFPANHGFSGLRTFFTNQAGDITATVDPRYEGKDAVEEDTAGAAFTAGGDLRSITGTLAVGTTGRDGSMWRKVN
jgi:type II secretory pathway pseudopilin PulG